MTPTTEFWNNRLAATDPPLEAAQTQIPHIPDQTEFIARWFEFHQGYRIAKQPDGTETHIAVIGEPFREVSPGFLPRTLDQLRAGRENDASRPENVFRRRRLTSEQDSPQQAHQTIEDALDDLLGNISDDDAEAETETETPATQLPDTQTPDTSMPRRRASTEALSRQPTETRLQRARDRITRVFGSREDVQRDDYESPLFTMYNRAEERYRQAEERRAAGDTPDPRLRNLNNLSRRERHELQEQILWGVLRDSRRSPRNQNGSVRSYTPAPTQRRREGDANGASPEQRVPSPPRNPPDESPSALRTSLNHLSDDLAALEATTSSIASARLALARQARPTLNPAASPSAQTLDEPSRPAPLSDAQMTLKLDCQVCYAQIADIAVLPCGHMVMCRWCADIAVPVKYGSVPVGQSQCPMCRRGVKSRVRIRIVGKEEGRGKGKGGVEARVVSAVVEEGGVDVGGEGVSM